METPVVVALIAGVIALCTSVISVLQQRSTGARQERAEEALLQLRADLESRRDREARERDEAEQLARYREPLLHAAADLHHRLGNIRKHHFLAYLDADDPRRSRMAVLSTYFRLGRYWGTVESLYGTVNLLAFEQNPATREVAALLASVGRGFATDRPELGGRTLMVWREEQRAIAELMQRGASQDQPVIGFATFVDRFDRELAPWFAELDKGLRTKGIEASPRLAVVQTQLGKLIAQLSRDRSGVIDTSS